MKNANAVEKICCKCWKDKRKETKREKWNRTKSERASERAKKPKRKKKKSWKISTGIQSVWVSEWCLVISLFNLIVYLSLSSSSSSFRCTRCCLCRCRYSSNVNKKNTHIKHSYIYARRLHEYMPSYTRQRTPVHKHCAPISVLRDQMNWYECSYTNAICCHTKAERNKSYIIKSHKQYSASVYGYGWNTIGLVCRSRVESSQIPKLCWYLVRQSTEC